MKPGPGWRTLLLVGFVAYLIFLVSSVPAVQVDAWTQSADRKLQFENLSGTVWSGHADFVTHPAFSVEGVRWRLAPLSLLLGRLEYILKLRDGPDHGVIRVGKDLFGRIHFGKSEVQFDASRLEPFITVVPVGLTGQMKLALNDGLLSENDRWVDGTLIWRQAAISAQSVTAPLGDLNLLVSEKDGGAAGALTDLEDQGPLGIDAMLLMAVDGSYAIDGTVLPRGVLQPAVKSVLEFMGPVDENGKYRITFSGSL